MCYLWCDRSKGKHCFSLCFWVCCSYVEAGVEGEGKAGEERLGGGEGWWGGEGGRDCGDEVGLRSIFETHPPVHT